MFCNLILLFCHLYLIDAAFCRHTIYKAHFALPVSTFVFFLGDMYVTYSSPCGKGRRFSLQNYKTGTVIPQYWCCALGRLLSVWGINHFLNYWYGSSRCIMPISVINSNFAKLQGRLLLWFEDVNGCH
jgi:hypothetical protein